MKITPYLILILLPLANTVWGQGFVKNYPPTGSTFQDVVRSNDGGYFMAGNTANANLYLQRVNANGESIWAKIFNLNGARAIATCRSVDDGFVVLTENYISPQGAINLILKVDAAGNVVWQREVGNNLLSNGLRDIIMTSDSQFVAAGDTRNAQLEQNIWLVKLTADGALLWSKTIGDAAFNEQVSRLVELPGSHLMVSGSGKHGANRDLWLTKTDGDGNLIWEKWYDQPFEQNAHDLIVLNNGGLAVLADTYGNDPSKSAILKTDADGVLDFFVEPLITTANDYNFYSSYTTFANDAEDNFYLTAAILGPLQPGNPSLHLIKLDAFGDSIWTKNMYVLGSPQQIIQSNSGQFVIVGGEDGNYYGSGNDGAFLLKSNLLGEIYSNNIVGQVYYDQNGSCSLDSGESPLANYVVRAENQWGDLFFASTTNDGTFSLNVPEGNFTVAVGLHYGTENFWTSCGTQTISLTGTNQTATIIPFGISTLYNCPILDVEIGATAFRRCMTSVYNLNYCNNGSVTATDVSIEVSLDPKTTYQSSTIPLTSQSNGVLTFHVPDIDWGGDCGSFNVTVLVDCDAALGEVLCAEAHIFPDSACVLPNANWDGSSLVVSGACNGEVEFTIRNTGPGNMTGQSDYVIMEDQIIYMQGQVQLEAGEDTFIIIPNPSEHAYYLHIEQPAGHPGHSSPAAFIDRCGGTSFSNLQLQLPQDEADIFLSSHCDEVVGSYDPNDKRGFPLGWQAQHLIEPGQELEYMIRFQNTGTDTAFQVMLRDTLSTLLDVTTLRAGASSHPYTYAVSGTGVLEFNFQNILLPDSNVNELASHGYVIFRLRQRPGLAQGDLIQNQAAIYFDFNAPIITNTTFHTIGYPLLSATLDRQADHDLNLRVFPNPATDQVTFQVRGGSANGDFQLSVFSVQGTLIRQENFAGTDIRFQRNGLLPGIYFFQLKEKSGRVARGKIIVR